MSASKIFSLESAIRIMVIGALVAVLLVIVQSCQKPKTGLDAFSKGSLKRLTIRAPALPQPSMTFKGPGDQVMSLQDYKGKIVLLNVWATWCAPCVIEMPMLNALQEERGGDNFEVVTISVDRQQYDAAEFFKKNDLTALTPWHDGTYSLAAKVGAPGLPISIFYNKSGREIARVAGEVDWTSPEARAYIDHLLE